MNENLQVDDDEEEILISDRKEDKQKTTEGGRRASDHLETLDRKQRRINAQKRDDMYNMNMCHQCQNYKDQLVRCKNELCSEYFCYSCYKKYRTAITKYEFAGYKNSPRPCPVCKEIC